MLNLDTKKRYALLHVLHNRKSHIGLRVAARNPDSKANTATREWHPRGNLLIVLTVILSFSIYVHSRHKLCCCASPWNGNTEWSWDTHRKNDAYTRRRSGKVASRYLCAREIDFHVSRARARACATRHRTAEPERLRRRRTAAKFALLSCGNECEKFARVCASPASELTMRAIWLHTNTHTRGPTGVTAGLSL